MMIDFRNSIKKAGIRQWILGLIALLLMASLGYGVAQTDFYPLIGLYAGFFLLYIYICKRSTENELGFYLALAIALRVLLLFSFPNLSDDIYRFIWDGRLIVNGHNPFDHLPVHYLQPDNELPGLTRELFSQLNSPEYHTVYPPFAQATYAFACGLFPGSVAGSTFVMKLVLLVLETGSLLLLLKLLQHFALPLKNVLWYALNPLIMLEITGNAHFEGAMIFFLLLALWWLVRNRWALSAVALALSVASKLLPLMFLPLLIRRLGWGRSLRYFLLLGVVAGLLFLPLINGVFLHNFGNSLDLYFRKFEFNASIYYLLRGIGFQLKGYNLISTIGPALALLTFAGIILLAALEKRPDWQNLPGRILLSICFYLLLTTTVHPWYLSLPLVSCIFTRFRFPVLWTGLIYLTYINYSYPGYHENLWVVGLEYGLVFLFFLYEWNQKPSSQYQHSNHC